MTGRKSLFLFLMKLAWRCRYSMPLLVSGTVALLGRAWMFQIRVHAVHSLGDSELALMQEQEFDDDDDFLDDIDDDIEDDDDIEEDDEMYDGDDLFEDTEYSGSSESFDEELTQS